MQSNNVLAALHNRNQAQCGVSESCKHFFSGINYTVAIAITLHNRKPKLEFKRNIS